MVKEFINTYMLYKHTEKKDLRLFAAEEGNFDIYIDDNKTLYSIAKRQSGCEGTYFGDCSHVRHLIRQGYFNPVYLTPFGRACMVEFAGFTGN